MGGMKECHREDKPSLQAQRQKEDPQFNDGEGKGPQGRPHASNNTNIFITVYGFLGSLENPQAPGGEWLGEGLGLFPGHMGGSRSGSSPT